MRPELSWCFWSSGRFLRFQLVFLSVWKVWVHFCTRSVCTGSSSTRNFTTERESNLFPFISLLFCLAKKFRNKINHLRHDKMFMSQLVNSLWKSCNLQLITCSSFGRSKFLELYAFLILFTIFSDRFLSSKKRSDSDFTDCSTCDCLYLNKCSYRCKLCIFNASLVSFLRTSVAHLRSEFKICSTP